jgi:hypothetical protein
MPVQLGEIDISSGIVLFIDPGLGRFWQHDEDPHLQDSADSERFDLAIVGPDSIAAGKAFDRQFDPRFLFDIGDIAGTKEVFAKLVAERKFDARLEKLDRRIPHVERARLAVEAGGGAGVVTFNGMWAVVVGNLQPAKGLRIQATPMPPGEFAGRWRNIDVVIDPEAVVAQSLPVQGVMVDHGQLMCADLEAFGQFRMWESVDGLADYVFWGKDAPGVAEKFHAQKLNSHQFGWLNVNEAEVHKFAKPLQDWIKSENLLIGIDYRPHCNLENLNAQIRSNDTRSGQLKLADMRVCGFQNRWGDGIFTVIRDLDAAGRLVRIRLDVGNEQTQSRLRRVFLLSRSAIVSRRVLEEGRIVFAERLEPHDDGDSGWVLSAGTESQEYFNNAANLALIPLSTMVQKDPELGKIIASPVGGVFRRTDSGFVPEK